MCMVQEKADIGPAAILCTAIWLRRVPGKPVVRQHEGLVQRSHPAQLGGCVSAYDDLLQEGRLALWRAIEGFDVERGVSFSTYAWPIIERAVWRAVKVEERQRKVPPLAWPEAPDPGDGGHGRLAERVHRRSAGEGADPSGAACSPGHHCRLRTGSKPHLAVWRPSVGAMA